MSTLFKKVDFSLAGLMEAIAMGQIGLPDLQRPFVWPNKKVRDLFDSMYHRFTLFTRVLLAAGFIPTGMVKLLGQRFTSISPGHPIGAFFEAM